MQKEFYLTYHVIVSTGLGNSYAITEVSAGSSNLIFDALNESGQCSWTNTNPNDNGGTKFIIDTMSTEIHSNTHEATIKFRVEFISFGSEDVNIDLDLDSMYTWS